MIAGTKTLLDAGASLARAERETGLRDYGDDGLKARLSSLVAQVRGHGLTGEAERAAADVIHWLLASRLRFFDDHKRYALDREPISRPVIATGEARSGTTLLHALLAEDPRARALRFWEVMYPSPVPGLAKADDPRIARADADWREIIERIPRWMASHPYNDMLGNGLPECERAWAFDFRATVPTAWWRAPIPATSARVPPDPLAQYRLHRMMLQHCQHGREPRYWVLKGTSHHHRLRALFETYPDAQLIWIHRDPVQATASRIVLTGQIYEHIIGHLDWKAHAAETLAICRANYAGNAKDPLADDKRIFHVRYHEFTHDPVAKIREVYEYFDVPFDARTETPMRAWLQSNKPDRYGKFVYSLGAIGEDIEALYREFSPYIERFGVRREHRN